MLTVKDVCRGELLKDAIECLWGTRGWISDHTESRRKLLYLKRNVTKTFKGQNLLLCQEWQESHEGHDPRNLTLCLLKKISALRPQSTWCPARPAPVHCEVFSSASNLSTWLWTLACVYGFQPTTQADRLVSLSALWALISLIVSMWKQEYY